MTKLNRLLAASALAIPLAAGSAVTSAQAYGCYCRVPHHVVYHRHVRYVRRYAYRRPYYYYGASAPYYRRYGYYGDTWDYPSTRVIYYGEPDVWYGGGWGWRGHRHWRRHWDGDGDHDGDHEHWDNGRHRGWR